MKVEIMVEEELEETKITIHTKEITKEINELANKLKEELKNIIGFFENETYILDKNNIESFYTEENKVFARTKEQKEYIIKQRIYELEEMLQGTSFVRISNSEIVNFNEVEKLDLSIIGTIKLKFKSGVTTYASRRNITKIKKYLNL